MEQKKTDAMPEKVEPVFIHGLFRTRSTWWWLQFRQHEGFMAFYEPFHQNLIDRTHAQCDRSHFSKDKATLFRHPKTSAHYFQEYNLRDEKEGGGVAGFDRHFIMENYVMKPGDDAAGMKNYVQSLLTRAQDSGQCAVLQFNRSTLRAEWLKAHFGGTHIYLNRDPGYIMNSARAFVTDAVNGDGGPRTDFLAFNIMIVGQNADNPVFSKVARAYGLEAFHGESWKEEIAHFNVIAATMDDQDLQDIIGYLWLTGIAHATRYADMIVDQELMSDPAYRQEVEEELQNRTGSDVVLDDFQGHSIEKPYRISEKMKNLMRNDIGQLEADWGRLQGVRMSDASCALLKDIIGLDMAPTLAGPVRPHVPCRGH